MPSYFKRLQYKEDSIRAFKWFQVTKDSSYIDRFSQINVPDYSLPRPHDNKTNHNLPVWMSVLSAALVPKSNFENLHSYPA